MSQSSNQQPPQPRRLLENFGVDEDGFTRPGIDTLWDVATAEGERVLGRTLTGPTSDEAQFVELIAIWYADAFERLEALYYSAFYEHAKGRQLDRLLALVGFERLEERQATGEVRFTKLDSYSGRRVLIEAGTRVQVPAGDDTPPIYFQTLEPAVIGEDEMEVRHVPIRALDPLDSTISLSDNQTGDATNVGAGAISDMYDAPDGVASVENLYPTGATGTWTSSDGGATYEYDFTSGRDRETDTEFRRRYENAVFFSGSASVEAIEAALRVAGDGETVLAAKVVEDLPIREATDADGNTYYTGRRFEPIVVLEENTAAARDAVAQALYDKRAAGIESYGETSGTAEMSGGGTYSKGLGFTIATNVEIHVEATIETDETFPTDGREQIIANLLDTIGGQTEDGMQILGKNIGEDIDSWSIFSDILGVQGVDSPGDQTPSEAISFGKSDPPTGSSDVTIGPRERAYLDPANVTITVV